MVGILAEAMAEAEQSRALRENRWERARTAVLVCERASPGRACR